MAGRCHHGSETNLGMTFFDEIDDRREEMSIKIIVSYDGTANENDAIALGGLFARAGAELALAYVRHTQEPERDPETLVGRLAQELLDRGGGLLGGADRARQVVADGSRPEG